MAMHLKRRRSAHDASAGGGGRAPGAVIALTGLTIFLAWTSRGAAQTTRPADAVGEQVKRVIIGLSDDDPKVRETAELQLRNLPAVAYPVIRDHYKPDDLDPSAQAAVESATGTLAARYNVWKSREESLEWEARELLRAYESSAGHAGPWDPDVREALALMPGLRMAPDDWLVAPRRLDRLRAAADAGCENPVVWACYAACDLEKAASDNPLPVNPLPRPRLGEGTPATDPGKEQVDPRCAERLRRSAAELAPEPPAGADWTGAPETGATAATGATGAATRAADATGTASLSAWSRCFLLRTWLHYQLATGGNARDLLATRSAVHAVLADALWDCPAEARRQMVLDAYELERWSNLRHDSLGAMDTLYVPYAKSEPGAVGPMLFKAVVLRDVAEDWLSQNRPTGDEDEDRENQKQYAARLSAAVEALNAAWKKSPGNPRVAAQAIRTKQLQGAARDEIDQWFRRAMETDPDNIDACHAMQAYLAATGGERADEELLEFGRRCRGTLNYRSRIAFMLLQSHAALAMKAPDAQEYFRREDVWQELRGTYGAGLRVFPDSALDRAVYAKLAVAAGDFDTADRQFEAMGGRGDVGVWGGQSAYDYYRLESARKAALQRSGVAPASPAPTEAERELAKVLEQARQGEGTPESAALLIRVAQQFPQVRAGTERGKALWSKLTLNAAGKGIDCIRIRTPPGRSPDMRWAFCYGNGRVKSWRIGRADGKPMKGFIQYTSFGADRVVGLRGPGDGGSHTGVVQPLPASSLEPDTQYLLEFRFDNAEPAAMTVAVNFLPAADPAPDADEILSDLGMRRR